MTDWLDDYENDLIDPQDGEVRIRVLDGVTKDECAQIIKIAYERGKRAGRREGSQPVVPSDEERARWDAWYEERRWREQEEPRRQQMLADAVDQAEWAMEGLRRFGERMTRSLGGLERAVASLGSSEPSTVPTSGDSEGSG